MKVIGCVGLAVICSVCFVINSSAAQQPSPFHAPGPPLLEKPSAKETLEDLLTRSRQALQQKNVRLAAAALQQAISVYPRDARGYIALAELQIDQKQYKEAEQAARSITLLNENSPAGYLLLAEAQTELKQYSEARQNVKRVVQMDPLFLPARLQLGRIALREKDYDAAETAFRDALGFAPDSLDIHSSLGDVYEQQNRHDAAVLEYDAALAILDALPAGKLRQFDAVRKQLIMSRASSLAGMKRYDEAENQMRTLLVSSSKEAPLHSTLAQVLDTAGKHLEAIKEYRIALSLSPNDAISWGNLGWSQYNAALYDEAVQSSLQALKLDRELTYVRFNLGLIYALQHHWDLARTEYSEAIKFAAPSELEAGIGDLRDALKRQPGSVELTKALDLLSTAEERSLASLE